MYRFTRALFSRLLVGLSLRITVNKLMRGVHVESKSMGEVLAIDSTIRHATERVRDYIDVAEGFDGREEIMSSDLSRPSVYTPFLRRFTDEAARDLAETAALYNEVRRAHQASAGRSRISLTR